MSLDTTNSIQKYAQTEGPHKAVSENLYTQLRLNLVKNVYENWEKTGFAWEQYNADTGKGQRTQHFTGWTSLVVKIMSMPDLSGGKMGFTVHNSLEDEEEGKDEL
jgi:mannosyl-oligosaccharide glucosidase